MKTNRTNTARKFALVLAALMATPFVMAADQAREQDRVRDPAADQVQTQTQARTDQRLKIRDREIFGRQMMTPQERAEFRQRMQAAKTVEERERIRAEHHEQMVLRAKERGIQLPEEMPAGRGPGMGAGMGAGMGTGAGTAAGQGAGAAGGTGAAGGGAGAGGGGKGR